MKRMSKKREERRGYSEGLRREKGLMRSDRVAAEACWPATRHPCTASHLALEAMCQDLRAQYQVLGDRCQVLCFKFESPCATSAIYKLTGAMC